MIVMRRLKEKGVYSYNCNKLNKTNMLLANILNIERVQKKIIIAEYPLHQLIRLDHLEIHIALSNPNKDVRILAQDYCVSVVSLTLL